MSAEGGPTGDPEWWSWWISRRSLGSALTWGLFPRLPLGGQHNLCSNPGCEEVGMNLYPGDTSVCAICNLCLTPCSLHLRIRELGLTFEIGSCMLETSRNKTQSEVTP